MDIKRTDEKLIKNIEEWNNRPITYEYKMKDRDNEFLYDKCVKQYHCIMNYQSKMREYKERIKELEEENAEYKLRLCKAADFVLPYRNGFNNWVEFLIEDKCKLLEILNGGKYGRKDNIEK